jgi:hypothetical protein
MFKQFVDGMRRVRPSEPLQRITTSHFKAFARSSSVRSGRMFDLGWSFGKVVPLEF